MKKTITTSALVLTMAAMTSVFSPLSLAHVTVKPAQTGVGAYQTFTAGVPNEKDIPTTGLRVVVPEGLSSVMPNVKPGWQIQTKTTKDTTDKERVSEIIWTGGVIPVGQRDEFSFSAKAPASETTIQWKTYQTYANGVVVAWDQSPDELKKMEEQKSSENATDEKDEATGPYSETKVINDLTGVSDTSMSAPVGKTDNTSQIVAGIALIASFAAVALGLRKK